MDGWGWVFFFLSNRIWFQPSLFVYLFVFSSTTWCVSICPSGFFSLFFHICCWTHICILISWWRFSQLQNLWLYLLEVLGRDGLHRWCFDINRLRQKINFIIYLFFIYLFWVEITDDSCIPQRVRKNFFGCSYFVLYELRHPAFTVLWFFTSLRFNCFYIFMVL